MPIRCPYCKSPFSSGLHGARALESHIKKHPKHERDEQDSIREFADEMHIESNVETMHVTPLGFYEGVSDEYQVLIVGARRNLVRKIHGLICGRDDED
jgi:hypothetical protein